MSVWLNIMTLLLSLNWSLRLLSNFYTFRSLLLADQSTFILLSKLKEKFPETVMILNIQLKVARFKIILQSVIKDKNLISKPVIPIRKFQFIRAKHNSIILTWNINSTVREVLGVSKDRLEGAGESSTIFIKEAATEKCKLISFWEKQARGQPWNVCIFYSSRFKRHLGEYFRMN